MLPGWGDWERCNCSETVRQWISSSGSYSALIYILSNAFEAQTMCWSLEMNTSSPPSPPPKADISYLTQILIYAVGQGFCVMPPSLPEWGAWNKTKCLEKGSLPPCRPGVLGAALCPDSNQQHQRDRRSAMAVGPIQPATRGWKSLQSAGCLMVSGKSVGELCLFHQSAVHRSWH